ASGSGGTAVAVDTLANGSSPSINEQYGSTTITLTRSDSVGAVTGTLAVSDLTEARFATNTFTLPAFTTTAFRTLSGVDDFQVDETQTVIVTPSTAGQARLYTPISTVLDVLDNETSALRLVVGRATSRFFGIGTSVIDSMSESADANSLTGTVYLSRALARDLIVYLNSSDLSEATVRPFITIPAGGLSAEFSINPVDELVSDGIRTVTITAFADGFASVRDTLQVIGDGLDSYDLSGDQNRHRDQGQVVIDSNTITNSLTAGISVVAGQRAVQFNGVTTSDMPHPGAPINFVNPNTDRLAAGVVIENNIIAFSGAAGISFRGDAGINPQGPVPFGRIFNNTIFGGMNPTGTGILVANGASPTILNNIVSGTALGVDIQASAGAVPTEVGHNLFQGNTNNGTTGSFAFVSASTNPQTLFVDPTVGNFYLQPGVNAIDSSLHRLEDRGVFVQSVKSPLGIPASAIVAPDRDVYGQLRDDDPNTDPLGGGSKVFKDRGAVERIDVDAPSAKLSDPVDGDSWDVAATATVVQRIDNRQFDQFTVQLIDGPGDPRPVEGTGVDPATVTPAGVSITQDGLLLYESTQVKPDNPADPSDDLDPRSYDYTQGYDGTNQILKLTPKSKIWEGNRTYVVTLNNRDRYVLTAPDGGAVSDGGQFVIHDAAGNAVTFEYESGYTIWVPQTFEIQAVDAARITDGDTFTITSTVLDLTTLDPLDTVTLAVIFEFDNNGTSNPAHTVVPYQNDDTAEDVARAIYQALLSDRILGLAPQYLGTAVHLGSQARHTLDVTSNSQLTQTNLAGGVADGDTFTLTYTVAGTAQTVTFEYDADGILSSPTGTHVVIPLDYSLTNTQMAELTAESIRSAVPQLGSTVQLGNGFINLRELPTSNLASYVLDTTASRLWQTGSPGVSQSLTVVLPDDICQLQVPARGVQDILDNETFLIDDGTTAVTFQFDLNRSGPTRPYYIPVLPNGTETQSELAVLLLNAIAAQFPNMTITDLGGGIIQFTARPGVVVDTTGTPNLGGVVRSGITDGQTFSITRAGAQAMFEFNNDAVFNPAYIQVGFGVASGGDAVANAMVTAIRNTASLALQPVYLGRGVIRLNETPEYTFQTQTSGLLVAGVVGGAVPLPYVPWASFTAENMAGTILNAINNTGFAAFGATATVRGGKTVFLDGAALDPVSPDPAQAVTAITVGAIRAEFVAGIRDRAGKFLQANQPDGSTRFTIILGAAGFDFGDLPDDAAVADDFRTLLASDGARHVQLQNVTLRLGSRLDTEADGQPTLAADGDDAGAFVDLTEAPALSLTHLPMSTFQVPDGWHVRASLDKTFTVTDGVGHSVTFTFVENGPAGVNQIVYTTNDSSEVITRSVVQAVQDAVSSDMPTPAGKLAGITAFLLDNSLLRIAGATTIVPGDVLTVLAQMPFVFEVPGDATAALISDQGTFQITDGAGHSVTFTFDLAGGSTAPAPAVDYYEGETAEILARRIVAAVQKKIDDGTLTGLVVQQRANGVVEVQGALAVTLGGGLRPYRQLPIAIDVSAVAFPVDGDQFLVSDGSHRAVVFEFDDGSGLTDATHWPVSIAGAPLPTPAQ
ncbi:MAG: right-handed parallel beta-helix repeat-containing protein, partial [Planctomycetota bacterium]|nr:right-handed parallel beta-helix repeat-containing protein [Planctomycetota bacterium]